MNRPKTPDIDSVGTIMLTELATKISETIADLYNKFLSTCETGSQPTAIFKKGKKCSPSNYRPVGLILNLCKVFESIVREKGLMGEHLEVHSIN